MHWHAERLCCHTILLRGYLTGDYEHRDQYAYVGVLLDLGDHCRLEGFHGPEHGLSVAEYRASWRALLAELAALGFNYLTMERHGKMKRVYG